MYHITRLRYLTTKMTQSPYYIKPFSSQDLSRIRADARFFPSEILPEAFKPLKKKRKVVKVVTSTWLEGEGEGEAKKPKEGGEGDGEEEKNGSDAEEVEEEEEDGDDYGQAYGQFEDGGDDFSGSDKEPAYD
jgi:hypothetical protein